MSVRKSFVDQFGEDEAVALEKAAHGHKNGVHDNPGSDPFKWVMVICIGLQCFEKDRYREYHGIKASFEDIKRWCIDSGELASHDGDCDYISLLAGAYGSFLPKNEVKS